MWKRGQCLSRRCRCTEWTNEKVNCISFRSSDIQLATVSQILCLIEENSPLEQGRVCSTENSVPQLQLVGKTCISSRSYPCLTSSWQLLMQVNVYLEPIIQCISSQGCPWMLQLYFVESRAVLLQEEWGLPAWGTLFGQVHGMLQLCQEGWTRVHLPRPSAFQAHVHVFAIRFLAWLSTGLPRDPRNILAAVSPRDGTKWRGCEYLL